MKIFQYHKVDRGYYEDAYQSWRRTGGSFLDHLLDKQVGFRITQREMTRAGIVYQLDIRSSLLLPQQVRCYLPLPSLSLGLSPWSPPSPSSSPPLPLPSKSLKIAVTVQP